MAVYKYIKTDANGKNKIFYNVVAEAINKYTGRRHQRKRRGISSRPKADKIYKELWNLCLNEKPNIPKPKNWAALKFLYFDDLCKKIRSDRNLNGISQKTFDSQKALFTKLSTWDKIHYELLTPAFVMNELAQLQSNRKLSQAALKKTITAVKSIFQFAVHLGILTANPFIEVKLIKQNKRKKKVALNHEEANFFLSEAKKKNHPYLFAWIMALTTGMRRSELAGLKWTDIDLKSGLAHIQRQMLPNEGLVDKTKSGNDRTSALPKFLIPVLKAEKLKSTSEFVISLNCKSWSNGNQAEVTKSFCREIGIKEITFHQLRATHITLAIVDNISLGVIKESVGHSKLSTTDEYFRSCGVMLKGKTDGLNLKMPQENESNVLLHKVKE